MKSPGESFDRFGRIAEVITWIVLTFAAFLWIQIRNDPSLYNDAYQYLSEARHLLTEHRLSTSLVFFDVERSHGQIPAPLTTFPPGYPIAIAAFGDRKAGLERTGKLISEIALSLTSGLLAASLICMGIGFAHRQLLMLLMVTNATFLVYGASLMSEPLFTFFSTAAVVGSIWIECRLAAARSFVVPALLTSVAAAVSCWIRYAGYFVIAALFLYALIQWLRYKNRQRLILLSVQFVPLLSMAGLMLRNVALTGTWKGGNDLVVHNRIASLLLNYVVSQVHLFFGSHAVKFGVWEAVLVLGILALVGLTAMTLIRHAPSPSDTHRHTDVPLLLASCIAVYTFFMWYLGVRTVVSIGTRIFMPILPIYILFFAWIISELDCRIRLKAPRTRFALTAGLALVAIGYAMVNARDLAIQRIPAPHEALALLYAMPTQNGQSMIDWILQTVPSDEAILSEESQGTGFLLNRPTVGMITPEYSNIRWECETIRPVMDRFHIRYIVLYRDSSLPESHFVSDSIAGHPPCGFEIAAQNSAILVLRNQPLAK
jgi:hypothetical protein